MKKLSPQSFGIFKNVTNFGASKNYFWVRQWGKILHKVKLKEKIYIYIYIYIYIKNMIWICPWFPLGMSDFNEEKMKLQNTGAKATNI